MRSQKSVVDFHCRVIFPCVNKIETLYGRSRKYVKIEPRSTFTFTRGLSYIAYISFTHVNFTYFLTEKLRNSGNQPQGYVQNHQIAFARGRKPCRKNRDFGEISVAERGCAAPISKVARHISERFWASLWCSVHTYSWVSMMRTRTDEDES